MRKGILLFAASSRKLQAAFLQQSNSSWCTKRLAGRTMADKEEANAGLEKVTDYHVEKELNEDDTANALSSLATNSAKKTSTEPSAEASLKISATDIEVLKEELEVSSEEAKTALLQGNGDVVQALRKLLR